MEKELFALGLCVCLIGSILFLPNVSADSTSTISIEIYRILRIDEIESSFFGEGEADWFYHVGVSEDGGINFEWQHSNIPIQDGEDDLIVNEIHTFSGITSIAVTVAIMLCEEDGGSSDIADISSDTGGGLDGVAKSIQPPDTGHYIGTYVGYYNLVTNTLTGDTTTEDLGYYKTSGEYDGNSDEENDAALWFDISDKHITVNPPSDGETWDTEDTQTITWDSENAGSNVKIELYKSGSYVSTITSSTSNDGSHSWTVPSSLTSSLYYKIKITSTTYSIVYDYSDYFSINQLSRYIIVTSPSYGETWYKGEIETIIWNSLNAGSNVKILYRIDSYYYTIKSSTSNDGSYSWTIPSSLSTSSSYKIKISSTSYSNVEDESDYFSIEDEPSIYVKSANSGETGYNGEKYTITWSSVNSGSNVKIELYKNGKYHSTIISSTSNDGRYTWTIPTSISSSSSYKIKITSASNSNVYDYSNNYLTIKETWIQKWLWAVVIAAFVIIIVFGAGIRAQVKSKEKKRVFEKEKKEIKEIIHKATSEKKKEQRKTEGKKKGEQKTEKNEKRSKKKDDKK